MDSDLNLNPGPSFPEEKEVSKYFPPGSWEKMVQYEKNSYLNRFHNYRMMEHMGIKPVKPNFMSHDYSKRSSSAVACLPPVKLPRLLYPQQSSTQNPFHGKRIGPLDNLSSVGKTKTLTVSSLASEILKFHLKYPPYNQHSLMGKVSVLAMSRIEFTLERQEKTTKLDNLLSDLSLCGQGGMAHFQHPLLTPNDKPKQLKNGDDEKKIKKLISVENENEHQLNKAIVPVKKPAVFKKPFIPKKPLRTVQVQTAKETESIETADLVFINSAAHTKLQGPLPPQPELNKNTLQKIMQWKKLNTRSVVTQTAREGESIKDAHLVFTLAKNVKKKPDNKAGSEEKKSSEGEDKGQAKRPMESDSEIEGRPLQENIKATSSKTKKAKISPVSQDLVNKTPLANSLCKNESQIVENLLNTVKDSDDNSSFGFTDDENSKTFNDCQDFVDKTKLDNSLRKTEIQKIDAFQHDISFGFTDDENSTDGLNGKKSVANTPKIVKVDVNCGDEFEFSSPDCSGVSKIKKNLTKNKVTEQHHYSNGDEFEFENWPQTKPEDPKAEKNLTGSNVVEQDPCPSSDDFDFDNWSQTKPAADKAEKCVENMPHSVKRGVEMQKKAKGSRADDHKGSISPPQKRRYPRRNIPEYNYTETELLQDDEYIFCDACGREYEGDCPEHGPQKHFVDTFAPVTGKDDRAVLTTPAMLEVNTSKIPGGGSGVWTVIGLPPHTRLGPYQGKKSQTPDSKGYSWTIMKDKKVSHYMSAPSTVNSNWMRFVNCARHESEQNLMAFQYKGELYYRTVKTIPPKNELFVWYGKEYAEKLGISLESFRQKDTSHIQNVTFPCEICGTNFTSPLYLKKHKKSCANRTWGSVVKVDVEEIPEDMNSLAETCDGRKTYICCWCDYRTTLTGSMRSHLLVHNDVKPYTCPVCGKSFKHISNLEKHKATVHNKEKVYKCRECPYSSSQKGHVKTHELQHSGEKIYACSKCAYTTVQNVNLKRHYRKHTGERPYSCEQCEYKAAQRSHLTTHVKRKHSTDRPYSCALCTYNTAVKGQLNQHTKQKHPSQ